MRKHNNTFGFNSQPAMARPSSPGTQCYPHTTRIYTQIYTRLSPLSLPAWYIWYSELDLAWLLDYVLYLCVRTSLYPSIHVSLCLSLSICLSTYVCVYLCSSSMCVPEQPMIPDTRLTYMYIHEFLYARTPYKLCISKGWCRLYCCLYCKIYLHL